MVALQGSKSRSRRGRTGRWLAATLAATTFALAGCTDQGIPDVTPPTLAENKLAADTTQQLEAAVNTAIAASGSSGAIIGVWVPWSGSWVAGVGTTTIGGDKPMKADMTFRIGDVTRAMTCDAFYGMVADGTVKADASVDTLVSGVPNLKGVTLTQLCNSTSGIGPLPASVQNRILASRERKWPPRELASFGLAAGMQAEPGQRFVDSDTGYLLLGLALERASGMSARDYIAKYVTTPLGLEHTSLPLPEAGRPGTSSPEGLITFPNGEGGYKCEAPAEVAVLSSAAGYTDSGVVSTITDLGTYGAALAQKTLAQGKDNKRYETPMQISDQVPSWFTTTGGVQFAGTLMGQSGSIVGYSTAVYSDPATGLTVAVMLNNSTTGADISRSLAWELAAIAAGAPASGSQTVPEFGVPWTVEDQAQAVTGRAICPVG